MYPNTFGRSGLGPADVGFRVVIRRELPTGQATDVLGELLSCDASTLLVRRADGAEVRVDATSVRAAKRIPPGPARVRPAAAADASAIEAQRIRCWAAAYRGMITDTYLDALPDSLATAVTRREQQLVDPPPGVRQLVAGANGAIVGWTAGGPSRDVDRSWPSAGEIYACYVAPEWVGIGLGRRLLRRLLGELAADGLTDLALWVLAANDRALGFYGVHGFSPDGRERTLDLGGPVVEVRCVQAGMAPAAATARRAGMSVRTRTGTLSRART